MPFRRPAGGAIGVPFASLAAEEERAIMANYFEASKSETRKFDVALANSGMTRELVKIVGEHHELGRVMVQSLKEHLSTLKSELSYENEVVESDVGYPKGWAIKPIGVQVGLLTKYFPGLDCSRVEALTAECGELSPGMDGWVVVPKYAAVDRLMDKQSFCSWPTYNRALKHLLDVMIKARPDFLDACLGRVGPKTFNLSPQADRVISANHLPGDVLMLPVQTGIRHRGKSVRRARMTFEKEEFGLDAFTVGSILLTHPERMKDNDVLMIRCPGTLTERGKSERTACWDYDGGYMGVFSFHTCRDSEVNKLYGSASAIVPNYLTQV